MIDGEWRCLLERDNKGDRYTPREEKGLKAQYSYPSFCFSPWFGGGVGRSPGLDDLWRGGEGRGLQERGVTSIRVRLGGVRGLRFQRWETVKGPPPGPNKHLISPSRCLSYALHPSDEWSQSSIICSEAIPLCVAWAWRRNRKIHWTVDGVRMTYLLTNWTEIERLNIV